MNPPIFLSLSFFACFLLSKTVMILEALTHIRNRKERGKKKETKEEGKKGKKCGRRREEEGRGKRYCEHT
jgi:hypothetical protein